MCGAQKEHEPFAFSKPESVCALITRACIGFRKIKVHTLEDGKFMLCFVLLCFALLDNCK
ncbi:hypothetical protein CGRA01v4_11445 [Colletotrichum graminicola]|nr:hypothetical protein CGRA01v4_11445 [Colletotrichum graminicola]